MGLLLIGNVSNCHTHKRTDKIPNSNHDLRALYGGISFA